MRDMLDVTHAYQRVREETGESGITAGILAVGQVLAWKVDKLNQVLHDFDHQLCMGIRHALTGTGDEKATLVGEFFKVAEAIEELAFAGHDIAVALEKGE